MGKVTTVGIDLAKNVFSVHAIDESGAVLFKRTVSRARLMPLVAQWPACLIGLEACSADSRLMDTRYASWPRDS
jgi:transposase